MNVRWLGQIPHLDRHANQSITYATPIFYMEHIFMSHSVYQAFPDHRPRRNRQTDWSRRLMAENKLSVDDLIWPIFVCDGEDQVQEIDDMPGVYRYSVDRIADVVADAHELGIPLVEIFPRTPEELKNAHGTEALNPDNLACRAVRAIKEQVPEIGVMCDVALDPYTDHGHDGLMDEDRILNDETVDVLIKQAINQAEAGYDIVAPSDMMDGRIGAIREAMDNRGLENTQIMSYAAKYASCFYGPFRTAVGSKTSLAGDKKTYQMDPANTEEALRETSLDIAEGADLLIVKPGMPYLDIVWRVKETFGMPVYAYQVSGEYSMILAAAQNGWLDKDRAMLESLLCFKRAGADGILTYFAPEVARILNS